MVNLFHKQMLKCILFIVPTQCKFLSKQIKANKDPVMILIYFTNNY